MDRIKKIYSYLQSHKPFTIALLSVVLLISVGATAASIKLINQNKSPYSGSLPSTLVDNLDKTGTINIVPLKFDRTGVDLDSQFKVTVEKDFDEEFIKSVLKVSPESNYSLTKSSDKEFLLSLNESLNSNKIYKFTANNETQGIDYSWAFQTKKNFNAVKSLPRNEATSVPLNSGIEITFTHENLDKIDKFFEIAPKVEGKFEYHKKTVVFVPAALEADTIYNVTIKKGYGLIESTETLSEDYTFSFQTSTGNEKENSKYITFSNEMYNFTSKVNPVLELYNDDTYKNKEVDVTLYKYNGVDDFVSNISKYNIYPFWARIEKGKMAFDVSKLSKFNSFKANIISDNDDSNSYRFIPFPAALPEGHYLVKAKADGIEVNTHLQINDLATYVMVGTDKTLVWVNDSNTGKPVAGANVSVLDLNAATKEDGVALINGELKKPKSDRYYRFLISKEGRMPFIALFGQSYYDDRYSSYNDSALTNWKYIYSDREMYLPTDSVNVWGFVKPRDDKAKAPTKAKLQLSKGSMWYEYGTETRTLEEIDVDISSSGIYSGRLNFENLTPGYYGVTLKSGDDVIDEKGIEVKEYIKPNYKITIDQNKRNIMKDEDVTFDIATSFFEGSPVPGIKLEYYINASQYSPESKKGELLCDSNGMATIKVVPEYTDTSWRYQDIYFQTYNSNAEDEEIRASTSVRLFPRDIMIDTKSKIDNEKAVVDIKTNKINIDKIKNMVDDPKEEDYRGNVIDIPLNIKITERYWESKEDGEYYDFIDKVSRKKYKYNEVKNIIKDVDIKSQNGLAKFEFQTVKNRSYEYTLESKDIKGRLVTETGYLSNYGYYNPSSRYKKNYTLKDDNSKKKSYMMNERFSFALYNSDKSIPESPDKKVLYMVMKNGLLDYTITSKTSYENSFKEGFLPNVYYKAAFFDGANISNAGQLMYRYDYTEKKLNISAETDKKDYKPGEEVTLNVSVKDLQGNPCKADVNVSVVDEAFFALKNQSVETLSGIFSRLLPIGVVVDYFSYNPFNGQGGGGAECGEGGDAGQIRSVFKDNAHFESITTGNDGKGKVTFKLPDNLTSWRITYQGIADKLSAGNGKLNINTKQPFFTSIIFNNIYMENDEPEVCCRAFGTALGGNDEVQYTVILEGAFGYKKEYKAKGKAFDFKNVKLEKLTEGKYSITIAAEYKDYKDAIKKDFNVYKNILESPRQDHYKLSEDVKITAGNSPVKLVFYNNGLEKFYDTLYSLYYSWGNRIDERLVKKLSQELIKKYVGEDWNFYDEEVIDLKQYQLNDGGIALLTYDNSDPELTAKIVSVDQNSFDNEELKSYFYRIINDYIESTKTKAATPNGVKAYTREQLAACYWGLASLGEPVLLDVNEFLKQKDLNQKEKLYLANAICQIGEYNKAQEIVKNELDNNAKKFGDTGIFIDTGDNNKETILEITALASIISVKLDMPQKDGLYSFITSNDSNEILTNLEKLYYVAYALPKTSQVGKFTYEIDSDKKEITLEKTKTYGIWLKPDMLSKIKFNNISGDVAVMSSYTGAVKDLFKDANKYVRIKRSYSVNDILGTNFKQSDFIKVTLTMEFDTMAPEGYYEITDVLPSGLRYMNPRPDKNNDWNYGEANGQKVDLGYYYDKDDPKSKVINYYARAIMPGTFTADNVFIRNTRIGTVGFDESTLINIGDAP